MFDLNFCSFRKQLKEVSVFAGAPVVFRICICSVIQKDQEKLVITRYKEGMGKIILNGKTILNEKSPDVLKKP